MVSAAHRGNEQIRVTVDVGNRQPVTVVVVNRLVILAGIVDDLVDERDAAFRREVGVLKVVKHLELSDRGELKLPPALQPGWIENFLGIGHSLLQHRFKIGQQLVATLLLQALVISPHSPLVID